MTKICQVALILILSSILRSDLSASQSVEAKLVDSNAYINPSESHQRCGKYFVLETRQFADFEVKQVHVVYEIDTGVAISTLYFRDISVVVDESKTTPVLLAKRDNPDLEKDTIRLSPEAYEEAKECLPLRESPEM